MGDFSIDTRVEETGPGRFAATLVDDWRIWGPNGGYLAVALRAVGRVAGVPRPASFTGHFLAVAGFAPVEIEVRTVRASRRTESFAVAIAQEGRAVFEGLVRTAAEVPGLAHDVARMPEVPPPTELKDREAVRRPENRPPFPFWDNFEARTLWPERYAEVPRQPHEPVWREWLRFQPRATFDDPWLDAGRGLLLIDTATWPAAAQPHPDSGYIAPNIDVTAWFHQPDAGSEWLLVDARSDIAAGGLMGTHTRIWSESGRLVASGGAQLLCIPQPG